MTFQDQNFKEASFAITTVELKAIDFNLNW